jgi:hypothetical protein
MRDRTSAAENCAVVGYYAASSVRTLAKFQDDHLVSSSRVKFKVGLIGCPETSVKN